MENIREVIDEFIEMDDDDIVRKFASEFPDAQTEIENTKGGLMFYRPVPDTPLLVAHTDTVWDANRKVRWASETLGATANPHTGIGADDRLGCAALWLLRNEPVSLLLVPDEEVGCIGSRSVAINQTFPLGDHPFFIQLDRRGSKDLVFYDCGNQDFISAMEWLMPTYSEAVGSISDISELCPAFDRAGVNISIGFYNEHTISEHIRLDDFVRTVEMVRSMLHAEYGGPYDHQGHSSNLWFGKNDDYGGPIGSVVGNGHDDPDDDDQFFCCCSCSGVYDRSDLAVTGNWPSHYTPQDVPQYCPECGGDLVEIDGRTWAMSEVD